MARESLTDAMARLVREGRIAEFDARYGQLKEQCPNTGARELKRMTLEEFPPLDGSEPLDPASGPRNITAAQRVQRDAGNLTPEPDTTPLPKGAFSKGGKKKAAKKPTQWEVLSWVAENGYVADVQPNDAPNAAAWAMLQDFRASADFRTRTFWPMYAKACSSDVETLDRFRDMGQTLKFIEEQMHRLGFGQTHTEPGEQVYVEPLETAQPASRPDEEYAGPDEPEPYPEEGE